MYVYLREEILPINHIFRDILHCILQEEVISMSIYTFMFPLGEFDRVTPIAEFRFTLRQIIQSAPKISVELCSAYVDSTHSNRSESGIVPMN